MNDYQAFLQCKQLHDRPTGLEEVPSLNSQLFDFQKDIVGWALRRGRAAIFADCGMGKTAMQLEWARNVPGRVLIVAPLAVATQTFREAEKFEIRGVAHRTKDSRSRNHQITVTNYERLHNFDPANYAGIVLDESSILKSYTGKFRNQLVDDWGHLPWRLCATATPAPNDFMELGNHAEFLGAMTRPEMLSMFFVHDGGETQKWRLKGHAESEFWKWLCSWAVMIRKPSDLGYDDGQFTLPPVHIQPREVQVNSACEGFLIPMEASTLSERQSARKASIEERAAAAAELANATPHPFLCWCNLNAESAALARLIPDAVEVHGGLTPEEKERRMLDFSEGRARVLITKPSIAGFGMNWQHCAEMAFVGLSDSYEQFYQALRRCWRFGQSRPVNAHVITSSREGAVVANIQRKEADAERMAEEMVRHMVDITKATIHGLQRNNRSYQPETPMQMPAFL